MIHDQQRPSRRLVSRAQGFHTVFAVLALVLFSRMAVADVGQQTPPPLHPDAGKLVALVIGVGKFSDPTIPSLQYADRDAQEFARALATQKGILYRDVAVKLLTNEGATREAIVTGLRELADRSEPDDVSLLFVSGHGLKWQTGATGKVTDDFYFAPYDMNWEGHKVASTGVKYSEILNFIRTAKGKKLVFLDTCHSGQVGELDSSAMVNLIGASEGGAMVWASTSGNEESIALPSYKHGAFTVALLDALYGREGAYRKANGRITQALLRAWLEYRVPQLTNGRQTPVSMDRTLQPIEIFSVGPAPQ